MLVDFHISQRFHALDTGLQMSLPFSEKSTCPHLILTSYIPKPKLQNNFPSPISHFRQLISPSRHAANTKTTPPSTVPPSRLAPNSPASSNPPTRLRYPTPPSPPSPASTAPTSVPSPPTSASHWSPCAPSHPPGPSPTPRESAPPYPCPTEPCGGPMRRAARRCWCMPRRGGWG